MKRLLMAGLLAVCGCQGGDVRPVSLPYRSSCPKHLFVQCGVSPSVESDVDMCPSKALETAVAAVAGTWNVYSDCPDKSYEVWFLVGGMFAPEDVCNNVRVAISNACPQSTVEMK